MKPTWKRINILPTILILVGAWAWINAIVSLIIASEFPMSAELILLFVGIRLLHEDGRHTRYALSLLVMAGLVVILVPVAAYTISPKVAVSLFGQDVEPYSYLALGYIILVTGAYLATIAWLYTLLRKDLRFEEPARV